MAFFRKIKAGLVKDEITDFIGEVGNIFFNVETGELRLSDGVTPGGLPIYSQGGGGPGGNAGILILDVFQNINQLPPLGNAGDAYLVGSDVYVWSPTTNTWINAGPVQGEAGYTGSRGESSFTYAAEPPENPAAGDRWFDSTLGLEFVWTFDGDSGQWVEIAASGFLGRTGEQGYTGSQGIPGEFAALGYTGSQGDRGYTGSAGQANNLLFSELGDQRALTTYVDPDGESYSIRTTQITNGQLILTLAAFTPALSATVLPATSLSWDSACTGFRVNVSNPADFPSKYISSVRSIAGTAGTVTDDLTLYTTTGPSPAPAGAVSWQQTFNTNSQALIQPVSSGISGGTASATITFNSQQDLEPEEQFATTAVFSVSWNTPTVSISMNNLTGNTYLQTYLSTPYFITVTGIANPSNYSLAVTAEGGTPSSATGNGSLSFTAPIHKDNTNLSRTMSVTATFTRPNTVTGASYSAQASASDTTLSASFTYPSFWLWTDSVGLPPPRSLIISGTAYRSGVTVLANQTKSFGGNVNNSAGVPRVLWFGVRAAAAQPTVFQTGASASLLSAVAFVVQDVALSPDSVPTGYQAEAFKIYGIILQPGNTYVSIS